MKKIQNCKVVIGDYCQKLDEILKNMDEKKISVIVLLDMSKLFSDIRHDLMESKPS